MRKITEDAARALRTGKRFKRANTEVDNGMMFLHGNLIAELDGHHLRLRMCGWGTPTTRERLNGILQMLGTNAHIYQEKFEQKLWWNGPGTGHYPLDVRKWMHFLIMDPRVSHDPLEWHPPRYFGQDEGAEERLKDRMSYISGLAVKGDH
ncbi:MAG: hypothetical protein Unbinned767contig1000_8 [Prokaryotic dsDNA virus sp.]|nr:MAG: hypothetical protein Unbinned767contig1000_8 [Prokaryotic dsDNA virus sp.]|tara:strand:+ start:2820 stop:3269 length:450 start_codon:yes stop_codon:yes gene_type:complete